MSKVLYWIQPIRRAKSVREWKSTNCNDFIESMEKFFIYFEKSNVTTLYPSKSFWLNRQQTNKRLLSLKLHMNRTQIVGSRLALARWAACLYNLCILIRILHSQSLLFRWVKWNENENRTEIVIRLTSVASSAFQIKFSRHSMCCCCCCRGCCCCVAIWLLLWCVLVFIIFSIRRELYSETTLSAHTRPESWSKSKNIRFFVVYK